MIVVLTGTSPYSFDRLVQTMDTLALKRDWNVFIQLGNTDYEPQNCEWERFVERERLLSLIERADFVVSQGGFGSLQDSCAMGKKLIAVPRQPHLSESAADQCDLVRTLEKRGCLLAAYDIKDLESVIDRAQAFEPAPSTPSKIPQIINEYLRAL